MGKHTFLTIRVVSTLGPLLFCTVAFAQSGSEGAPGDPAPSGGGGEPSTTTVPSEGGNTTIVVNPPTTSSTTTTTTAPWGVPSGDFDPDSGLPSSAREAGQDGFDLNGPGNTGSVRGGENSSYVLSGKSVSVPPYHNVRRGDTLWDLCDQYYDNPYAWPRVWSYNPQIENPHWIYPGDRIRMRTSGGSQASQTLGNSTFMRRQSMVPSGTVFLRDRGYVGDERKDVWGMLSGSPQDQMLLSDGDEVYLSIDKDHDVRIGQEFTIFNRLRRPDTGKSKGYIVAIKGTAKVVAWDSKTRIARAKLTESLDVIERGDKVGPIGRRFDVVPPVPNDRETWAHISAAVEPHELIGQYQVVFIDKGSRDGLRAGNRLFVVMQGDRWRDNVRMGRKMAMHRMNYQLRRAEVVRAPDTGRGKTFPPEVVGEVRVLRAREHTSVCVVTYTEYELEPGQLLIARRGY